MARYLTDEDVFRVLSEYYHHRTDIQRMALSEAISRVPTADVMERRKGKWISIPHKLARICSICSHDEPYKFADEETDIYNYCPYCGADMSGRRENE